MSRTPVLALGLVALSALLAGCGVIETIFEAGMWTGIVAVVALVAAVAFLVLRVAKKK